MTFLGFHNVPEFTTYVTFVLLGMSIMMVVSAITSAPSFVAEYYRFATGNPDAVSEKPQFWTNVITFYNVGTYVAQLLFEPLSLTPFMRRIPLRPRMIVALCVPLLELLLLLVIPAVKIPTQDGAIVIIMVVGVLGGFSKAMCNSSTNALCGPFPTKYINGAQWGLTVSALFMSLLQVILKASMGSTFEAQLTQSRIYLGIAVGIQAVTLGMFLILYRNPFAQEYTAEFRVMVDGTSRKPEAAAEGENNACDTFDPRPKEPIADEAQCAENVFVGDVIAPDSEELEQEGAHGAGVLALTGDADHIKDLDQVNNITSSQQMLHARLLPVVRKVWPMLSCIGFTFFLTLLIFPGLFFAPIEGDSWYPTIIVLLFNVGDFLARITLMVRLFRPSPWAVVIGTVSRLAIVPLLALCVRHIIRGVWLPYVLVLLHGFTNGYFGSMGMIHCPRTPALTTAGERSLAAILAGVFLMIGLCAGSNGALAVNLLL